MKLKRIFLAAALFVVGATAMKAQQMPPIPQDQNVRIGKLDNGLTYYIRYNNWPENKANFYIAQRVGSIQENEDQRGLAHFLEHMAFNGSEHFPDSTLLEYTRSLGVEFGSDLNAYTSIDQTVYRICNVPTARATAIDSCILILKDWSNGLTLDTKEIDKERGVIHQEWQMGSGPTMRMYERMLPKLYPGCKYGERLPIGLMEVVDNFDPEALRAYYRKWYRPDNQAIIVVGNVDVDHVEAVIKDLWKDAVVPADAAQVVAEPVPDNAEAIYVIDKDKEQQFSIVNIMMKHDPVKDEEKGDIGYLLDQYAKQMISMMMNLRLEELSKKADCPFIGASAADGTYIFSKTKDNFEMQAFAKDDKDLEALAAIYREALRVRRFGFTPGEYDRVKAEYLSQLEKEYNNRDKVNNSVFGNAYRDHYLDKDPIPSIETKYQIMSQLLASPMINVDVMNEYAKELISEKDSNLVVSIMAREKEGKVLPTTAQMAEAVNGVRAETLEAYVDNTKNEPLIAPDKMPKAGKIVKEKENNVLGYKELELSNGAKVVLKKTDFKNDEIRFQAIAKGGKSNYGENDFINLNYFDGVIAQSGLGNFSNTELQKALYGKQVSVSLGLSNFDKALSGHCVPKDIETLMQLVYLNFTNVSKDEDSYNSMMQQLDLMLSNKGLTPEAVYSDSLVFTLYGRNPRFAPSDKSDLPKISYDRIMQIWKECYGNARGFVFYFVGNYDEATIRPLIEQYIASLPSSKNVETSKPMNLYPTGKVTNLFSRKMDTPKATAFMFWHTKMPYNVENEALVDAAGQVLSMVYLKDIREDASAAYSVNAGGGLSRQNDNVFAVMQAYCPMDPEKAGTAIALMAKGIADNSIKVDEDKVAKVKENMLKNADIMLKNNGHWMNVIDEYVWTGVDLNTNYKKAVSELTPEKIADFLKRLLASGNEIRVIMTPEK
ncbi:MAG: insulinase family protein [Prevotella sp.]|uniref:M16 family metallopeptidase n=1 Tax=Prevotella sp. TaxID=59823 RepID=UPI002A2A5212|nr:insulinase family protein [Prevotella sp.]MDD7317280.1 insulinase family protein [Prevotellaceae bacterium]MDY4019884.1 insulinase family protein [Prevotella sp.]